MKLARLFAVLVLPVLLTGCLLIPGKFESTMLLKRDGTFNFTYKGEVVFQLPDDKMIRGEGDKPRIWADKMAVCWSDDSKNVDEFTAIDSNVILRRAGSLQTAPLFMAEAGDTKASPAPPVAEKAPVGPEAAGQRAVDQAADKAVEVTRKAADESASAATEAAKKAGEAVDKAAEKAAEAGAEADDTYVEPTIRKCKKAEIAELKKEWTEKRDKEIRQAKELSDLLGRIIGMDPTRPESMARFAEDLQKHADWRSVVYKGDGVFLIDYQHSGRMDQDFVFPILPEQQIIVPFVTIKRRADGSAMVETPGYSLMSNGGLIGSAVAVGTAMAEVNPLEKAPYNPLKGISGRFTLTTDGEILTNNTRNGPSNAPTGKVLTWQFREARDPAPKALIKLR